MIIHLQPRGDPQPEALSKVLPSLLCHEDKKCCLGLLSLGSRVTRPLPPGHSRGVVVAGEVDVVLDEHSEVFSAGQECRPGTEECKRGQ